MLFKSRTLLLISLLSLSAVGHSAIPNIPEEEGWGGWVVLGLGYTDIESNTVAGHALIDVGKDTIGSINDDAQSDDTGHAMFTGQASYTFGDRYQAFVGSSIVDRLTLDFTQQVGLRKQFDDGQKVAVGLLYGAIPNEVWEDPYQEGVARNETDRDSSGVRVEWDSIMGTGGNLSVDYRDIDIDKDLIGTNLGGGCDLTCQADLQRDGDSIRIAGSWLFKLSDTQMLLPAIRYTDYDADGAAQDRDTTAMLLTWSYMAPDFTLAISGGLSDTSFDNPNPLYDIKQDADGLILDATIFYNLSNDGAWQIYGNVSYGESDSDINFHDQEASSIVVGVYRAFGNQRTRWMR